MKKLLGILFYLISSSAVADYKVTLEIERPGKEPITITEVVPVNKMQHFSSGSSIEYISALKTTTSWYHAWFGIEPTPVKTYAEIEVGVRGNFEIAAGSEDDLLQFVFDGQIEELLSMDTLEYDIVSFPSSSSTNIKGTHILALTDGFGCLKPFFATDKYSVSVCAMSLGSKDNEGKDDFHI